MFFEDYVLRQISLLVAVLQKIAGLKKAGKFEEAYKMIDRALEEVFGLDASIVKQIDDDNLIDLLNTVNGPDLGKLFVLASLLEAEGDVLAEQHFTKESREYYQHALNLFLRLSIFPSAEFEAMVLHKINELQEKLATWE